MKQALIVDPHGSVEDFASTALGLYELTNAGSLQEAVALASSGEYQLVLIAGLDGLCPGAMWSMVEQLTGLSAGAALVLVQTETADGEFHARARELGVTVLSSPLGVAAKAAIEEATLS